MAKRGMAMERETARVAGEREVSRDTRSPFIVWEGGREEALPDLSSIPPSADGLSLAMESPRLPVRRLVDADVDRPRDQGATTALPSSQVASARPRVARFADARETRTLDWHLIRVSLLLFAALVLGAMVARGSLLGAAYGGLQWEEHRVVAGETLDSILAERNLPDVGIGRLADWVEERNGLRSSAIVPGQVLSVPR